MPANATVDGVDVSALNDVVIIDHETRIAGLEGKDPSVDSSQLATARLTYNSSIVSSYNISSVTSSREYYNGAYTTAYTVYFSTPRSNANYSVSATATNTTQARVAVVLNKTTTSFEVVIYTMNISGSSNPGYDGEDGGAFDAVVFGD